MEKVAIKLYIQCDFTSEKEINVCTYIFVYNTHTHTKLKN